MGINFEDLAIGDNVQISYSNGDAFTGVVVEVAEDYIGLTLDMSIEYTVVKLNKEWIDTIEEP